FVAVREQLAVRAQSRARPEDGRGHERHDDEHDRQSPALGLAGFTPWDGMLVHAIPPTNGTLVDARPRASRRYQAPPLTGVSFVRWKRRGGALVGPSPSSFSRR